MDTPNGTIGLGPVSTQQVPRPEGAADGALRSGPLFTHGGSALEQCLLLSLGHPVEITGGEWDAVFECAVAERCAALAWLRSESRIRTGAPAPVIERWAQWIAAHMARVERQLTLLAEIDQWLEAHGIAPVVLKGIPLSARLYGTWWARTINDIDLYIAPAQCTAAGDVLRATGWRHLRGAPPDDSEFIKQVDGTPMMAELHASLTGAWFAGHPFPEPEFAVTAIQGRRLRVHSGNFVPAYLASHLLQHSERPLLWLLDFRTLWSGMLEEERAAARQSAAAARLAGVLALAEGWAATIDRIERERDPKAVDTLRRDVLRPTPGVAFRQLFQSASEASDAARMTLQLVWPREYRGDPVGTVRMWSGRIMRRLLGSSTASAS